MLDYWYYLHYRKGPVTYTLASAVVEDETRFSHRQSYGGPAFVTYV